MAKVTMPQLGESVAEGTIGKWLKKPGDHVAKYEPLLEVITDKVNAEVPSPFEGTLTEILVEEGATVPNNAEIAVIETTGGVEGDGTSAPATTPEAATTPEPATRPESATTSEPAPAESDPAPPAEPAAAEPATLAHGPAGSDERPAAETRSAAASEPHISTVAAPAEAPGHPDARMTPAVRRLLREHGLEAAQIVGTGGSGRLTREDVLDYVEAVRTGKTVGSQAPAAAPAAGSGAAADLAPAAAGPAATAASLGAATAASSGARGGPAPAFTSPTIAFPPGADEVLVPMTQMRKGIAAQMIRALAVPHAYVQMEADVTTLVRLRESQKRGFQAREGLSLSYVPFVIKASVEALKRYPQFNAHWTDQGVMAKRRVNIGVAVAVPDGLLVPVVRDVDQLSIAGLNRAIIEVADRARANKLRVDDFGGGTFTIDNTGYLGSNMTMPIINVPEVAILTMEAITKRAVVVETADGDSIAIRPVMNLVLAIDHRANDGAGATAFLRDVKASLESIGPDTAIY